MQSGSNKQDAPAHSQPLPGFVNQHPLVLDPANTIKKGIPDATFRASSPDPGAYPLTNRNPLPIATPPAHMPSQRTLAPSAQFRVGCRYTHLSSDAVREALPAGPVRRLPPRDRCAAGQREIHNKRPLQSIGKGRNLGNADFNPSD
jgi:hypothetical protein